MAPRWFRSGKIDRLQRKIGVLVDEIDALKTRFDVPDELEASFRAERERPEYQAVYDKTDPLVSICVPTYHKPQLLTERCLESLLSQTYANIEILVIGDCCTDDTDAWMARIQDPRLRYENLPTRASYPEEPKLRWMVAGIPATNRALELARGDFITHLDHDDEHTPDRVDKLVAAIQKARADIVYHPFYRETSAGEWKLQDAPSFERTHITTSSVLYHRWFRCIPFDPFAYRFRESGDWNRYRKLLYMGARIERVNESLLRHYAEQGGMRESES